MVPLFLPNPDISRHPVDKVNPTAPLPGLAKGHPPALWAELEPLVWVAQAHNLLQGDYQGEPLLGAQDCRGRRHTADAAVTRRR